MMAKVVGCIHPVDSPAVMERGGMPGALSSFLVQLVKVLFPIKNVTDYILYISFKQEA